MADTIYSSFIETKNGSQIPLLKSGRTLESRYNPQKEAENIINSLDSTYSFFLILGLGSGILAEEILKKIDTCKIIILEKSQADFDFLKTNQNIKKLLTNERIITSDIENLSKALINNYLPAKYGSLKIIEQKNWLLENSELKNDINMSIQNAINQISADFSVQSHFGKIWTTNILNNIKLFSQITPPSSFNPDLSKTALVVAAGPSLDSKITQITEKRNQYYIISTDTAFSTLLKQGIESDIVISLDCQSVSQNHFIHKFNNKNTLFLFDLCGNFSAAKSLYQKGQNISYFISGHPLSNLFNYYCKNKMLKLESGAGTVTIAALDFALQAGFNKIEIFGADFAYLNGKSYTKATYLDKLYNSTSNKLLNSEKIYDKLLFRTELTVVDKNKKSTKILDSYKNSLINFLNQRNLSFEYKNDTYFISSNKKPEKLFENINIKYSEFISFLSELKDSEIENLLLPYISWLRNKPENSQLKYKDFLQLAHSFIVSYN